jgi:2-phosphoglycerate kinase
MTVQTLAAEYRRIVELLQGEPGDGEGVSAKELAARLGLENMAETGVLWWCSLG